MIGTPNSDGEVRIAPGRGRFGKGIDRATDLRLRAAFRVTPVYEALDCEAGHGLRGGVERDHECRIRRRAVHPNQA